MSAYTLTEAEFRTLKRRLSHRLGRMKRASSPEDKMAAGREVIREADRAVGIFEQKGYPDCWSDWERARDDAGIVIRMAAPGRM